MIRRIFAFTLVALLLGACVGSGPRRMEVGSVTLIADGIAHEPYRHAMHGYWDGTSSTGMPFKEHWLEQHVSTMQEIQYADDLQIVVDGRDARIASNPVNSSPGLGQWTPAYYDGVQLISIPAERFSDGKATVSLPNAPGAYLLFVDITWSVDGEWGGGGEFRANRYVFKVVR